MLLKFCTVAPVHSCAVQLEAMESEISSFRASMAGGSSPLLMGIQASTGAPFSVAKAFHAYSRSLLHAAVDRLGVLRLLLMYFAIGNIYCCNCRSRQ